MKNNFFHLFLSYNGNHTLISVIREKQREVDNIFEIFTEIFVKINFLFEKLIFFDEIFFEVHLLVEENRVESVLARFRSFKNTKSLG